jgi:hypothetical protein
MKKLLFLVLLSISLVGFSQNADALIASMKSGNSSSVAKHFEQNIEMTLLSNTGTFSKAQGEGVLRNFFNKHTVKGFEVSHQGTSPEGAKYFVGSLATSTGSYTVYLFGKNVSGVFLIREFRIEEK